MNKHYLKEYVLLFEFLISFFGSTTGFCDYFSLFISARIFVCFGDLLGDVNVFGMCSFFIRFQLTSALYCLGKFRVLIILIFILFYVLQDLLTGLIIKTA